MSTKGSWQRQTTKESVENYTKNHEKIYGNKKPRSGKWVQKDGKLVEVKE